MSLECSHVLFHIFYCFYDFGPELDRIFLWKLKCDFSKLASTVSLWLVDTSMTCSR